MTQAQQIAFFNRAMRTMFGWLLPDVLSSSTSALPTGAIMQQLVAGEVLGWVRAERGSIGKGGSAATERADDDTLALYTYLWNGVDDSICPVAGGRGSNATADFNAGKVITLPDMRGRVFVAATAEFTQFNVPVGTNLGEVSHQLIESELPMISDHTHGVSISGAVNVTAGLDQSVAAATPGTTDPAGAMGGGDGHNNIQPTTVVGGIYLKL